MQTGVVKCDAPKGVGKHTRITAEQVAAVVETIDKKPDREPKNKQLKDAAREFKKDILPRKQKYEKGTVILKQIMTLPLCARKKMLC